MQGHVGEGEGAQQADAPARPALFLGPSMGPTASELVLLASPPLRLRGLSAGVPTCSPSVLLGPRAWKPHPPPSSSRGALIPCPPSFSASRTWRGLGPRVPPGQRVPVLPACRRPSAFPVEPRTVVLMSRLGSCPPDRFCV